MRRPEIFGIEDVFQRSSRHTLDAARAGLLQRCLLILGRYFLGAAFAMAPMLSAAQSQSVQYTYDAAGRLVGVTNGSVSLPDLTVSNLTVGAITSPGNGSYSIPVTFQVNNIGTGLAVAAWYDYGYLSANTTLHNTDQVLAGYTTHSTSLGTGTNYTVSTTYTTSTTTTPGNWYLIVKADGGAAASGQFSPTGPNHVAESNESNNTQTVVVTLPANPLPDLTVSNASIGAITVSQNGSYSFPATFQVNNIGNNVAKPTWYDLAYLSTNGVLDNNSLNLSGYNTRSAALAAGSNYTVTTNLSTPTTQAAGTYTLFIKADGHGAALGAGTNTDTGNVVEANETNNTQALSLTLPIKPDLTVSNASIGAITVGQSGSYNVPVTFTVHNVGSASAQPTWYDLAYLSTNGVLDNNSLNLFGYNTRSAALAAGSNYTVTTNFSTPTTQAAGTYTLFIKADGHGAALGAGTNTDTGNVVEANETNNTQALSLTLPIKPDLTVSNLSVGTIVKNSNGSYNIPVSFQVNNIGASTAVATWYDLAYLSTNGVLDNNSQNLAGYHTRSTALAAGSNYTVSMTSTSSTTTTAGTYTLFIKADGHGAALGAGTNTDTGNVVEANETNNTASTAVVLR